MQIYNLISIYTNHSARAEISLHDYRPLVSSLGVFDDFNAAKKAMREQIEICAEDGFVPTQKMYSYSTDCRLTREDYENENQDIYISIVQANMNISIGERRFQNV